MSVWSDRTVLERCAELAHGEPVFPLVPGAHVARGFADVGYEEFVLLARGKLVSLFTGQASELTESQHRFFFVVPTADMVIAEIDRAGWDVLGITCPDGREWRIALTEAATQRTIEVTGPSILETVLAALLALRRGREV